MEARRFEKDLVMWASDAGAVCFRLGLALPALWAAGVALHPDFWGLPAVSLLVVSLSLTLLACWRARRRDPDRIVEALLSGWDDELMSVRLVMVLARSSAQNLRPHNPARWLGERSRVLADSPAARLAARLSARLSARRRGGRGSAPVTFAVALEELRRRRPDLFERLSDEAFRRAEAEDIRGWRGAVFNFMRLSEVPFARLLRLTENERSGFAYRLMMGLGPGLGPLPREDQLTFLRLAEAPDRLHDLVVAVATAYGDGPAEALEGAFERVLSASEEAVGAANALLGQWDGDPVLLLDAADGL